MVENLLLSLPESLTQKLLVDWLHITDVVRVDSAHCSRKLRVVFCNTAFRSTVYQHFHSSTVLLNSNKSCYMEWLLRRQVYVDKLSIPMERSDLNELYTQYFGTVGGCLQEINLTDKFGHGACYRPIDIIAKNCPKLVVLSITSGSMVMEPAGLQALFESCHLLRKLCVVSYAAPDLQYRNLNGYVTIATHCTQLERLELENCYLSDIVINRLAHSCGQLSYLSLSYNPSISDTALATLMTRCPNVMDFNINRCSAVADATIVAVATHCPQLQRLQMNDLPRVTNDGIAALQMHAPQLRYLSMVGCTGVTHTAVVALIVSNKQLMCKTKPCYPTVISS